MAGSVVFVTRKFPPSVGGMETLSAGVWRSLRAARPDATLLSLGRSNRALLWWLPLCVLRLIWLCARRRVDHVLCGDALMNAVCAPVLALFRVRRATMIMGLDVTYDSPVYRLVTRRALRSTAHVIAISEATAQAARDVGVPAAAIAVLRLGVQPPPATGRSRAEARRSLQDQLGLSPDDRLLLTLGRLVPRKGVRWFSEAVLPGLGDRVQYLVAGSGPDEHAIREAARSAGVSDRVHLLGRVPDALRDDLLGGADVFVQPNVPTPGDMEGFGLVTVEAAMHGMPVVAAALEGIKDAVIDGVTGVLVPPQDAPAWITALQALPTDAGALAELGETFGAAARELYSESAMGEALMKLLGLT